MFVGSPSPLLPSLPHAVPRSRTGTGRLLVRTKRTDTVDALVATTAIRLGQPTIILTSDPTGLKALTESQPLIRVVSV